MELKSDGRKYGCNHNDCGYCHKSEVSEVKCIGVEKCQEKHPNKWRKIVTRYVKPSTPVKCLDWMATYEDYDLGDSVGYGATESEAVQDLKEKDEDE